MLTRLFTRLRERLVPRRRVLSIAPLPERFGTGRPRPIPNAHTQIPTLPEREQARAGEVFAMLVEQLACAAGLNAPFYLALDNSVLKALVEYRDVGDRAAQALGFAEFIRFARSHLTSWQLRLLIEPVVYYEFNRRTPVRTRGGYERLWTDIADILRPLECPIYQAGLGSSREAAIETQAIDHDVRTMSRALAFVEEFDWARAYAEQGSSAVNRPMYALATSGLAKRWRAFDPDSAHHYLYAAASRELRRVTDKLPKASRPTDPSRRSVSLARLVTRRIKDRSLSGIGDLQLFSLSNVQHQFVRNGEFTIQALTVDAGVHTALLAHAARNPQTPPLSRDTTKDELRDVLRGLQRDLQRSRQWDREIGNLLRRATAFAEATPWMQVVTGRDPR